MPLHQHVASMQADAKPRLQRVVSLIVPVLAATFALIPPLTGQDRAYIGNYYSSSVSVVDTTTHTVIATIPVEPHPLYAGSSGIAISPDGSRVYVVTQIAGSVSVIDTSTNAVIATIKGFPTRPYGIALTPDGSRAFVTIHGDYPPFRNGKHVSVIDTRTNTIVHTINVADLPLHITLTPNGKKAYVSHEPDNRISVIDVDSLAVLRTIAMPGPLRMTPSHDGRLMYVANRGSDALSVIDTQSDAVVETIAVGQSPSDLKLSPDGLTAYVVNQELQRIAVVDLQNRKIIQTIPLNVKPYLLSLTPDAKFLYVTTGDPSSENFAIIDLKTNAPIKYVRRATARFPLLLRMPAPTRYEYPR
jgi:YVTN family beta-propeller protein